MLGVDLAILLACIFFGARLGGIALGTVAAAGLAVLVFACGRPPGALPLEVIRIILCVICAAAALEAAGGLDWMVQVVERLLRERPQSITLVAPLIAYGFTFLAGTEHVTYALLPVIVDVAHQAGVRPERPLSIAVIASQQAITASPLSAATAGMVALLARQQSGLGLRGIRLICVPATLLGVVAGALAVWRMGPELADDPGYQQRLRAGEVKLSQPSPAALASTSAARWSVGLFLAASVASMVLGMFPVLRPGFSARGSFTRLDMVDTISILMLAASASIMVATKATPHALMAGRVMPAGIVATVSVLGMAWLGSTFFAAHEADIVDVIAGSVQHEPWLFSLGLFVLSILLYSQAATVAALMPVGAGLGIPLPLLIAMFPAVNGYFFLPTYGTVVAAINFDHTGTTTAGRYLLDHSFMRPGLVATGVAVVTGVPSSKFSTDGGVRLRRWRARCAAAPSLMISSEDTCIPAPSMPTVRSPSGDSRSTSTVYAWGLTSQHSLHADAAIVFDVLQVCGPGLIFRDDLDGEIWGDLDHGLLQEILQIADIFPAPQEDEQVWLAGAQRVAADDDVAGGENDDAALVCP